MRTLLFASGMLAGMLTLHGCGGADEKDAGTATTPGPEDDSTSDGARSTQSCQVLEPTIPGYTPGVGEVPRILVGIDLWSPWALIDPADGGNLKGFLPDFVEMMNDICTDIDINWIHTGWGDCFAEPDGNSWVGGDIKNGAIHACAGYTHTGGTRNRLFEFSHAVTRPSMRTGGFISRLKADGTPEIPATSDLKGVKVVDVAGWAPTADNIQMATNDCSGGATFAYTDIVFVPAGTEGNKAAMAKLKSKEADIIWVYSDQAYNCQDALDTDDCSNWDGFGTEYAYIHTGLPFAINGTTMAIAKRGSGAAKLLNPCIAKVLDTKAYEELCAEYEQTESCWPNDHFAGSGADKFYNKMHSEKTGAQIKTCAEGYCPCPA
jgi:hypothetical protein